MRKIAKRSSHSAIAVFRDSIFALWKQPHYGLSFFLSRFFFFSCFSLNKNYFYRFRHCLELPTAIYLTFSFLFSFLPAVTPSFLTQQQFSLQYSMSSFYQARGIFSFTCCVHDFSCRLERWHFFGKRKVFPLKHPLSFPLDRDLFFPYLSFVKYSRRSFFPLKL